MTDLIIGKTNVTNLIDQSLAKQEKNWIFMMEVPEESYFEVNLETIDVLISKQGYSGLYISLHRPYKNLVSLLKGKGINTDKLSFIDAASSQAELQEDETENCTYISKELNIDELTRAVYKMLPKIKGENKFVFLDSITTLALYQPLSEALRFTEFLNRTVKNEEANGAVVNVAKDLAQKEFIKDIVMNVDEVIKIGGNGNGKDQ